MSPCSQPVELPAREHSGSTFCEKALFGIFFPLLFEHLLVGERGC
jgi:hypothetical protein